MIVSEHNAGTAELRGIDDYLSKREFGAGLVAFMTGKVEAACLAVDVRDPKALAKRIGLGKAAGEKVARGREAV
jgi:hypothetical protein